MARARAPGSLLFFLPAIPRVILLVFLLVSAGTGDENHSEFN
jgi:hypothetical protein